MNTYKHLNYEGKKIYYEYDKYQDALFVWFVEKPPTSYYEELVNGIMVRKDAETDETIGITVRNMTAKFLESILDQKMWHKRN